MEIIKKTLLLFLASAAILIPVNLNAGAKPIVYFVHGLQFECSDKKPTPKEDVIKKLEEIFPNHTIKYYEWSSYLHKKKALKDIFKDINDRDREDFGKYYWRAYYDKPKDLADELFSMPHEQLERVILIGHSLGGVIVVKTMEKLAKKGFKIDRGIFLGTALECDINGCNSITTAIQASKHFNINIYNEHDKALAVFRGWCVWKNMNIDYLKKNLSVVDYLSLGIKPAIEIHNKCEVSLQQTKEAFGAHGYKKSCPKSQLMQIEDTKHREKGILANHDVEYYLDDLDEFFQDYRKIFPEK